MPAPKKKSTRKASTKKQPSVKQGQLDLYGNKPSEKRQVLRMREIALQHAMGLSGAAFGRVSDEEYRVLKRRAKSFLYFLETGTFPEMPPS